MKNAVIAALVVALAVSIAAGVIARASRTVNVEVRVWQDVDQPDSLWLSARPDGGSWADLGTIPVPLDGGLSGTGRYRYGDVVLTLSVPPSPSCADAALAPDCAVLLAARDALAGDGALNWSADAPLTEWDGVSVSGTPRRVTALDLRNRGLTGTIPPELGSLPPTLATVWLGGNAFTGCVPERLRLAENDLEALTKERRIWYCPVTVMPSATILSAGTYQFEDRYGEGAIIDIPDAGPQIALTRRVLDDSGISRCLTTPTGENRICLDEVSGVETLRRIDSAATDNVRRAVDVLFDQIAATARRMPPPSCAEAALAPDCAILLAARDVLAGDGELNWSADVPVEEWDGVNVPWSSRRVEGLYLGRYGLTGTIPPELGSLPPTLSNVYLAGNAFTGCVPERLRLATANDLERLRKERGLPWCPVAAMPSGEVALAPGTYQVEGNMIIDIPVASLQVKLGTLYASDGGPGSGYAYCFSDLAERWEVCLDTFTGKEILRRVPPSINSADGASRSAPPAEVDALLDQIAATARPGPLPLCGEPSLEADCAVLLAARDALAGDGALNWSPDVPVEEWDGVNVPWSSRRVEGLYLRRYGLTGTIPPELGSLPPTLAKVYLAGNAFTGCVPERLRLATANDLEELMAERGLPWCPVALVPDDGTLTPGTTYQMSSDTIIIDVPTTGPRIHFLSIVAWEGLQTGGLAFCFSDLKNIESVCLDGITGEEWSRGSVDARQRNSEASGSLSPPPGLDAVFDAIVATARPAP